MNTLLMAPILGVIGMVVAFVVYQLVMKYPDGEDKVKKIGDQIHNGALAFMKTEYKYLLVFVAVLYLLYFLLMPLVPLQIGHLVWSYFDILKVSLPIVG